jgi:hypothetical protein
MIQCSYKDKKKGKILTMGRISVIQNDEVLMECLETGEEFFIPCADKNDAHSKAVSLINARRRLSVEMQRKLRVQKVQMDGVYGVKVSPGSTVEIYKIVNGAKVIWNPNENRLSDDAKRMVSLMIVDLYSDEDILLALENEKQDLVLKEIKKIRGE